MGGSFIAKSVASMPKDAASKNGGRISLRVYGGDSMKSYLEIYCDKILNKEILSCDKIKTICKKLKHDIHHPGKYHFDQEIANHHVNFIQRFCKTPSGKIGTPLKLALFQVAWLEAIFGFVDDEGCVSTI